MSSPNPHESSKSEFLYHEACPQCREHGGDWHGNNLARYSDGHGYCFTCNYYEHADKGESSNAYRKEAMDVTFDPVPTNCEPVASRKLTVETTKHFGYGMGTFAGKPCQVAPYYDEHGNFVAQHIRFADKSFKWLGDASSAVLFGQHLWKAGSKKVVVTEGEIDCLSVSQLQENRWPVVSLPNGASAAVKAFKKSLEWLESFEDVVIAFDMDEPGQKAAKECAALLSSGKAKLARLPEKDANDCLKAGKGKELINALWQANAYRPEGIKAGTELWDSLMESPPEGYEIPYPQLNDMLQGFRLGELYLFTAGSGIGKSTLVNEIAYHLKMKHGLPLGILALEESPTRNARRYLSIHLNKPLHLPHVHAATPKEELQQAFDEVMKDWWIYDHFGSSDIDTLMSKLRYMAVGLGVKVILLDHISIVVSGLDEDGESERKTIDKLMTRLRSLIEETGIMVLAIVHLKRKGGGGKDGQSFNDGGQVSLTDLRGSGSLEQISDVVVAMERNQQSEEKSDISLIRVLKNRPIGRTGVAGTVKYYSDTARLLSFDDVDGGDFGFEKEAEEQQAHDAGDEAPDAYHPE